MNDTTRTPPEAVELIKRFSQQRTNTEIAAWLHAAGLRTGKGLHREHRADDPDLLFAQPIHSGYV